MPGRREQRGSGRNDRPGAVGRPGAEARGRQPTASQARAAACIIVAAGCLAGCVRPHSTAAPPIKLASAYLMQPTGPGIIDGYLVIQNSGSADQLMAVRSSAGGTVVLRGPTGQGTSAPRTVSALSIPGHSIVRLDPAGIHLVITRSGRMRQGTEIMLTLVFARAGTVHVTAEVINPQTGGSNYLGP